VGPESLLELQSERDPNQIYQFTASQLRKAARSYSKCLEAVGIAPGATVQIYDFGSSLISQMFGNKYCPLPIRGPVEELKCKGLFNDGLADFLGRGFYAMSKCGVDSAIIRRDLIKAFLRKCDELKFDIKNSKLKIIIGTSDSELISRSEFVELTKRLKTEVSYIFRIDELLFLSFMCRMHSLKHYHFLRRYYQLLPTSDGVCLKSLVVQKKQELPGYFLDQDPKCGVDRRVWGTFKVEG
jgi:hypothetical protein